MQINEVSINLIKPDNGLIGFASFIIENSLYVSGVGIHQRLDGCGHRLTYPTRKSGNQMFDIFHPINRSASQAIEEAIFEKLKNVMNRTKGHAGYNRSDVA